MRASEARSAMLLVEAQLGRLARDEKANELPQSEILAHCRALWELAIVHGIKMDFTADPLHPHVDFRSASVVIRDHATAPLWTSTV